MAPKLQGTALLVYVRQDDQYHLLAEAIQIRKFTMKHSRQILTCQETSDQIQKDPLKSSVTLQDINVHCGFRKFMAISILEGAKKKSNFFGTYKGTHFFVQTRRQKLIAIQLTESPTPLIKSQILLTRTLDEVINTVPERLWIGNPLIPINFLLRAYVLPPHFVTLISNEMTLPPMKQITEEKTPIISEHRNLWTEYLVQLTEPLLPIPQPNVCIEYLTKEPSPPQTLDSLETTTKIAKRQTLTANRSMRPNCIVL